MGIGEGIEVTDAWVVLPPDRDREVIVAAARALHRKADEFASYSDALRALGLVVDGRSADGIVWDVQIDGRATFDATKLFRAIAAGADEDSMRIVWDTRGGSRDVYRVDFDGAGHFRIHYLV